MTKHSFHQRVERILSQIAEISPDQVDQCILETCKNDPAIESEVRSLLQYQSNEVVNHQLKSSIIDIESGLESDELSELPQIDGFTVKKLIGEGSYGIVYAARQHLPERDVALKILKSPCLNRHASDRAQIESHLLARLDHPHIAKLYAIEFIETGAIQIPFLIMEHVKGRTLSDTLLESETTQQQALIWLGQICRAVSHAHKAGIIHRDIKPGNILISSKSGVGIKLIDFGVAKLVDGSVLPIEVQTAAMSCVGTQKFMSPERVRNPKLGATTASDVYSVGIVAKDMAKHVSVQGLGGILLSRMINQLTAPLPETRPPDLCEVAIRLERMSRYSTNLISLSQNQSRIMITVAMIICSLGATYFIGQGGTSEFDYNTDLQETIPKSYRDHRPRIQSNDVIDKITSSDPYSTGHFDDVDLQYFMSEISLIDAMIRDGDFKGAMDQMNDFGEKTRNARGLPHRIKRNYLITKARCLIGLDRHEEARFICHQARDTFPLQDNPSNPEIHSWLGLAHTIQSAQDRQSAQGMYLAVLDHPRYSSFEWQQQVKALQLYAGLLWLNNEYIGAEKYFREAIKHEPKDLDKLSVPELGMFAGCYSSLGLVLLAQSQYLEAETVMTIGVNRLSRYRSATNVDICRLQRNLASCYLLSGKYEKTKVRAQYLYRIWRPYPDTRWNELASILLILGSAEIELGNLVEAEVFLREGQLLVHSRKGTSARRHHALIQSALGVTLSLKEEIEEAQILIRSAHEVIVDEYAPTHPWRILSTERFQSIEGN